MFLSRQILGALSRMCCSLKQVIKQRGPSLSSGSLKNCFSTAAHFTDHSDVFLADTAAPVRTKYKLSDVSQITCALTLTNILLFSETQSYFHKNVVDDHVWQLKIYNLCHFSLWLVIYLFKGILFACFSAIHVASIPRRTQTSP